MEKIITDNLDAIRALCRRYYVKTLYVFGSATGRGIDGNTFGPDSDIDLLVEYEDIVYEAEHLDAFDIYMDTYYALKALLGREIDLVSARAQNSTRFKRNVEQTKQAIYA